MVSSVSNQSEARLAVSELQQNDHAVRMAERLLEPEDQRFNFLRQAVRRMTGNAAPNIEASRADLLKMAEYALLIEPMSQGIQAFVHDPHRHIPKGSASSGLKPSLFSELVGRHVYFAVKQTFDIDPNKKLIEELAEARADLLTLGEAISPVLPTLKAASQSSATNVYTAAVANALAAHKALNGRVDHKELVAITRRSHQLPLARPMSHLYMQHAHSDTIDAYNRSVICGEEPAVDILRFDPNSGKVMLASNPKHWGAQPTLEHLGGGSGPEDVAIGCPITFSSSLLRAYYETVVDLVEEHDLWPDIISARATA